MATFTKLPSGKFRAQVRKSQHYKSKSFAKKSDAQKWAIEIERQIESLTAYGYVSPANLTIGHVISQYHKETKPQGKTKNDVLKNLTEYFKTTKPDALSVEVQKFIDYRLKMGVKGSTLSGDLSYLAGALDWAKEAKKWAVSGDIARSARAGLKHRKISTRSVRRERIPTNDELNRIYSAYENNKRLQTPMVILIKFAIASGMRQGEITRITIDDFDIDNRTVIIRDRKAPKDKIGNDQVVPLLPDAFAMVVEAIGDRHKGVIYPYNSKTVSASFTRTTKALKIIDLNFHDLRHLAITNLFRAGLTIPQVAIISGHKSWENLKRYTQLNAADVHSAFGALND